MKSYQNLNSSAIDSITIEENVVKGLHPEQKVLGVTYTPAIDNQ